MNDLASSRAESILQAFYRRKRRGKYPWKKESKWDDDQMAHEQLIGGFQAVGFEDYARIDLEPGGQLLHRIEKFNGMDQPVPVLGPARKVIGNPWEQGACYPT